MNNVSEIGLVIVKHAVPARKAGDGWTHFEVWGEVGIWTPSMIGEALAELVGRGEIIAEGDTGKMLYRRPMEAAE